MAIVSLGDMKGHLSLTEDQQEDDALIVAKINAAQNHIERMLGFQIAARFGGEGQPEVPPALHEGVMQLAAWWFENRETVTDAGRELPFGISDIVTGFREWTF